MIPIGTGIAHAPRRHGGSHMRAFTGIVLGSIVLAALAGCGGTDDGEDSADVTASKADRKSVV